MPTALTLDLVKKYTSDLTKRHKAYAETVKIYDRFRLHANGEIPGDLLSKRRPSETQEVFDYRLTIFESITEEAVSRVINCLGKIRKSHDWSIFYDDSKIPKRLSAQPEETLRYYTETAFPYFNNITTWLFNVALKNYLIDPNAVILVAPLSVAVKDGDFIKPFPLIFNSPQVYEFIENDIAVLLSTDQATYVHVDKQGKSTTYNDGKVYYIVNTEVIQKYSQVDPSGGIQLSWEYRHGLNALPVYKVGGMFYKALDTCYIYKSRANAIIPRLNEATREYSDLQAEVVQHMHSDKWVYQSNECTQCNATGQDINYIPDPNNLAAPIPTCKKCNGDRYISTSPYKHLVVNPTKAGENNVPIPPAGYIEKSTEIVKIQDERIEGHIYKALAAIEMQFLAQVPLNQSGRAKEVDRDGLNVFVHSVAEDLVNILDKFFYFCNEYRYKVFVADPNERRLMLPSINVPDNYDLLSVDYLISAVKTAREAGLNPIVIKNMEMELAAKQFNGNPAVKAELQMALDLDPFFGISDDIKDQRLLNKGISQEKYVLSCNIADFIRKALRENPDFAILKPAEQLDILFGYVELEMQTMSAAAKVNKLIATPDPTLATA